jgi:hypothetical protein
MRIPASEQRSAWFPDLAVDREGRVHVVFCSTNHADMKRRKERKVRRKHKLEELHYVRLEGGRWSAEESIALAQQPILRSAIAVDSRDALHLLFNFSPGWGHDLHYRRAAAREGFSERNWRQPQRLNTRFNTYLSDVATFEDTVHVVYDDRASPEEPCAHCADIFYRRSRDRGRTWSAPLSLRPSPIGSSRAQITVDGRGAVYVAWDEGWDRLSGRGKPKHGVYMASAPGDELWTEPLIVTYPNEQNVQLAVGATGRGGVMLVWRTTSNEYPSIYYQWSADWGGHWTEPGTLPDLVARKWDIPFDVYRMATDGGGNIHLLVAGRSLAGGYTPVSGNISAKPPHGLYHLAWNGARWTPPHPVYKGKEYPEYPRLFIAEGNQLHATFFTRFDLFGEERPHRSWYVRGSVELPEAAQVEPPVSARFAATYAPVPDSLAPGSERPKKTRPVRRVKWANVTVLALSLAAGAVIVAVVQLAARAAARISGRT